ncbi:MAG: TauD/TfdA family dioxygenase [Spirochaetaceae bacterium]|nr:TauD/TfdA family dioxygenase [Spirochaetaceae bacterium]
MTPSLEPVRDPSAWTAADLARDRSWDYEFSARGQRELEDALRLVQEHGLALAEITREAFPLPSLQEMLGDVQHQLRAGRGFALLRGVPVDGHSLDDLEKLYWGLGTYLGTAVTQNSEAGLIHYVTDGKLRPRQGTRGVGNPGKVEPHVDLADCVGLFCIRQAPDDPPSLAASSMTVYNEILRRHPDWLPRLYEGYSWTRMEEEAPNESPVSGYRVPVFSAADGTVTCRFNAGWIRKGAERAGTPLTEEDLEMFEFIRATATGHAFSFPLHAGEIAWMNNYTVFHGRAAHEPVADEQRKRLLLRLWLDLPDVRPFADEGRVRYGVIRHGKLGWTAADLLAGNHRNPHRRRPDGVPVVAGPATRS